LGRLEKSNGTLYWRSYAGQVIEETNTSGTMTRDYIFFAGRRIAWRDSSGNVYYYFVDAIGSTRGDERHWHHLLQR
jgi:YD repeat-containing protein